MPAQAGGGGPPPATLSALIAAFLYLLLSGAEVATQRSFIMAATVPVAVVVDRSPLTLRNLALRGARRHEARARVVHPQLPDAGRCCARTDRRLARRPGLEPVLPP
jgi:hypothetical protein